MTLPELAASEFGAFFNALWGYPPFPWQARLAQEQLAESGRWPDLLDLPTGSGKTAAIDVAVFHLALQADRGPERAAAMRIAFVVDRRLVVDEAFQRARRLECELKKAASAENEATDVVRRVALRLKSLAGEREPPLVARQLRGGAPREDDWARTPCQPTVLCSTVDQVGSRLLFRGYGVTDSMKPVHAGLLGSDALILLDEAHLSEPFRQTARDIATVDALRGADRERSPFHVALLTATPGGEEGDPVTFRLGGADREHPVLKRRLSTPKPAVLKEVGAGDEERGASLATEGIRLLATLQGEGVANPAVAVISNRIARARTAFNRLNEDLGDVAEVLLVIGRARSVDREELASRLEAIKTGRPRTLQKPLIVVATQTIEAGVDIDLDGLVTEAASLDALRQRFGRVNRDGRDVAARGVILFDKADRRPKKPDPIYGEAVARTLERLFPEDAAEVDFGVFALDARLWDLGLAGEALRPLLAEKPNAPVLMPAYVDLWTHTAPVPACDPDAALFLHGPRREPSGVQLVWRADVERRLEAQAMRALLSLAPPRASEAVEMSVWAARRWLAGERAPELGDAVEQTPEGPPSPAGRSAFRWRGFDDPRSTWVAPDAVGPGDILVVPAADGGYDEWGWNPDNGQAVSDVFAAANAPYAAKRYVVRVAPGLIRQAVFQAGAEKPADPAETIAAREERLSNKANRLAGDVAALLSDPGRTRSARALAEAIQEIAPEPLKGALARLGEARRKRLDRPAFPYDGEDESKTGVVFVAPLGIESALWNGDPAGSEDDEAGSFIGRAQSLIDHSGQVQENARVFAGAAGLPLELVHDLALAGWLHDAGKADLRFQWLLYDGDALKMQAEGPRAKSDRGRSDRGAWDRAKLPPHWRHEALSVRLALVNDRLKEAHDRALVLWLVGTHHGHGRPFFPHADPGDGGRRRLASAPGLAAAELEPGEGPQSLGFVLEGEAFGPTKRDPRDLRGLDWATLFRELKAHYGPWGLARLEAVLRLADHRASEAAREEVSRPHE